MKSVFCCLLLILIGCQNPPNDSSTTLFSQNVMTIQYRITVGHSLNAHQKQNIQKIINKTFNEIDRIYNKWNPHSELSQLNQLNAFESRELSPQLFEFFKRIDYFVHLSNGLFDPTLEPLQQLWKHHLEGNSVPSQKSINSLKPCLGWDKIHFDKGVFYKEDSRCSLDLGGIAKGLAVDLLVERLNQAGYPNVFVEWGGEIRASGEHPKHRPWKLFISRLGSNKPEEAIAVLELTNKALATSGDYFQFWNISDQKGSQSIYCHIFHPKTLSPHRVEPGKIASASIMADDCVTADALAKVLMLFERDEEAQTWLRKIQEEIPSIQSWTLKR